MSAPIHTAQHRRWALFLIWLTPLLWTVNIVVARTAPGLVSANVLALGRWALAGVLLAWVARQELWTHRQAIWAARWQYLALGTCGMWICGAWVYWAGESTTAMNISLIYAASPVMIALGAVWWLGERFSLRQSLGVVLAMAGVVHVVVQGHWRALAEVQWVLGDLLIVVAAMSWAAYALMQKKWVSPLGSTARLAAMCAGGVVVLLPFALWELTLESTPPLTPTALWLMVLAALLPGVVAYWVYGWTQKVLGASRVAVTLYLGPLYTAVAAWLILNEPMGWFHLLGGLMILAGIGLVMAQPSAPHKA
ncbi:RhaT Permeases of the drug/metabolite transporter (DMT) superfamily [Burkholderiaceae bacterium]